MIPEAFTNPFPFPRLEKQFQIRIYSSFERTKLFYNLLYMPVSEKVKKNFVYNIKYDNSFNYNSFFSAASHIFKPGDYGSEKNKSIQ